MNRYFAGKNYLALYTNTIGTKFASTLVLSFVGAYLFNLGLGLSLVLLYFALEFGLRSLVSPFGGVLATRIGFKKTISISYLVLVIYFVAVSLAEVSFTIGFFSFIFHSISRGLYYPNKHLVESLLVFDGTRGSFLSLEAVISTLVSLIAVSVASTSLFVFNSFVPVVVLASLFLLFAVAGIHSLDYEGEELRPTSLKQIKKFIASTVFRKDLIAFSGFATNIVVNNVLVGLFIFLVVGDFKAFGFVMAFVLIAELVFLLLFGRYIDRHKKAASRRASYLNSLVYLLYPFARTPATAFLAQSVYKIVWGAFDTSFTARFHSKMKESAHPAIYASAKETVLWATSSLTLFILAALSQPLGERVFVLGFIVAVAGVWVTYINFKPYKSNPRLKSPA